MDGIDWTAREQGIDHLLKQHGFAENDTLEQGTHKKTLANGSVLFAWPGFKTIQFWVRLSDSQGLKAYAGDETVFTQADTFFRELEARFVAAM
jgi:hypothetical protein